MNHAHFYMYCVAGVVWVPIIWLNMVKSSDQTKFSTVMCSTFPQLLYIRTPITIEHVSNQNCEQPVLEGAKVEAQGGSNEVLTPTLLYYVIML